jgi:hypothetical protein
MSYMSFERPLTGGPLLTPTTRRVTSRRDAVLSAIGASIYSEAARNNPFLTGCTVAPHARFVLAATSLDRPLLFPECDLVAQCTEFDVLLLRFDPDRGTNFDLLLQGNDRWLCRYLAWRKGYEDLWFIPTAGEGPFIRASGGGLERLCTAPFATAAERESGIILALDAPSFEGRP